MANFDQKLRSGYYSNNGFPYVSPAEAKTDKMKAYERERYEADRRKRHAEFIADALEELGLTGHPKAQQLFDKAWEMGHSSGYNEVWYYMCELEELMYNSTYPGIPVYVLDSEIDKLPDAFQEKGVWVEMNKGPHLKLNI